MVADVYGYHVERALGLLGGGRSLAKLQRIDSCLSGIYALTVYGALQQQDETSVTRLFSLLEPGKAAPAAGPPRSWPPRSIWGS